MFLPVRILFPDGKFAILTLFLTGRAEKKEEFKA